MPKQKTTQTFTRREVIRGGGVLVGAAVLTACAPAATPTPVQPLCRFAR